MINYPLISEYVEAIKSAEDDFATLTTLRPVLDGEGNPVMTSGNFAVVFKMRDEENGKLYAVKCFLKDQPNRAESYKMIADELEYVSSTFLVQFRYLDKELFVDTNNSDEQEFPVLVMDWVDGVTLDKYIRQNIDDQYALQMLAYQFSKLAMWIIPQPFAHGDIKPDNVMVREDGTLVLIDYDGMYVPAMKGQKARELGSPDFRHPSRTEDDFNEHIDDFSLITILLSLRAIANDSSLLDKYGAADRLLFSEKDYRNISSCQLLKELYPSTDIEINTLVSLFTITLTQGNLSKVSFRLLTISRPEEPELLSTEVTEEDLANAWTDEYGVLYSKDRKKLLKVHAPTHDTYITELVHLYPATSNYYIKEGTQIICDYAFNGCDHLKKIIIPSSVKYIGNFAFNRCDQLINITIPSSVISIGKNPFKGCYCKFICLSTKFEMYDGCLYTSGKKKLISFTGNNKSCVIPLSVTEICDYAFSENLSIDSITIPISVRRIAESAFYMCECLKNIKLPSTLTIIEENTFSCCESLKTITIPSSVKEIRNNAFDYCKSLNEINIPISVTKIGDNAFEECENLKCVYIPSSIMHIGKEVFAGCYALKSLYISHETFNRLFGKKYYSDIIKFTD